MRRSNFSVSACFRGALFFISFFPIAFFFSQTANAEPRNIPPKEERSYISGGVVLNEFRSIGFDIVDTAGNFVGNNFPMTGQTYALAFTYGSYITKHFKTEIRYGRGVIDNTFDKLVDANLNHWFSWYMGATHPVTEDFSAYALYGVSFYEADMTRRQDRRKINEGRTDVLPEIAVVQPSRSDLDDDFFKTNFSTSWMLGMDYRIEKGLYLAFEYGRLLRDTDTKFKVYQAGLHLRYEY
jgi:hypothetical protein